MQTLFDSFDGISAEFSPDEIYRYTLTRQWDDGQCIAWLMFNPSTATITKDDHTIRKCIGFSRRWGFGRLIILNLYAVRNTDPRAVARMGAGAVGPMNDYWIKQAASNAREIVCAWGCAQHAFEIDKRIETVFRLIGDTIPMSCLGYRKDNHPKHPLTIGYDVERVPFARKEGR